MKIIEAHQVSRTYKQKSRSQGFDLRTLFSSPHTLVEAVRDVSFSIDAGESIGYVGLNGAGKSTMIKMLAGILVPSSGAIEVLGRTPHVHRQQNAREIGAVFGQRTQLWWDLPISDSYLLHKELYDLTTKEFSDRLEELLEVLGAGSFIDRAPRQLSLGQRMRAELVLSLLHRPKILFLDEPTIGLDIVAKDSLREFLKKLHLSGDTTIFLATHDLDDIDSICSRVMLVDKGTLVFDGELTLMAEAMAMGRIVLVEFASDPGAMSLSNASLVGDMGRSKKYRILTDNISPGDIISELEGRSLVTSVSIQRPSTEDVVRFYLSRVNS